jgi:hypothetical protein
MVLAAAQQNAAPRGLSVSSRRPGARQERRAGAAKRIAVDHPVVKEKPVHKPSGIPLVAAVLIASSVILYYVHYLIFHDAHHIFIYLLGDVAFVPLEVLLVVIVIERILSGRERRAMLNKLNMVIGAFFSEVGTRLLGELTSAAVGKGQVWEHLAIRATWRPQDFRRAIDFARSFAYEMDPLSVDLVALRDFLASKRSFMIRLLENPNLLEHERFTDLLWAIFHLTEELADRESLDVLSENDRRHLAADMERAYSKLTGEWLAYAQHLQTAYPFLFSLVLRTHPLQEHPSAAIP